MLLFFPLLLPGCLFRPTLHVWTCVSSVCESGSFLLIQASLETCKCQLPIHTGSEIQLQESSLCLRIPHVHGTFGQFCCKSLASVRVNCNFIKAQNSGQTQADFLRDRKSPSLRKWERKNIQSPANFFLQVSSPHRDYPSHSLWSLFRNNNSDWN